MTDHSSDPLVYFEMENSQQTLGALHLTEFTKRSSHLSFSNYRLLLQVPRMVFAYMLPQHIETLRNKYWNTQKIDAILALRLVAELHCKSCTWLCRQISTLQDTVTISLICDLFTEITAQIHATNRISDSFSLSHLIQHQSCACCCCALCNWLLDASGARHSGTDVAST